MKRIFLIEDDQAIAKNLMLLLQSEGFIVTHAATRKEATDTLADNKFDLALIDISLPDGNGFTVCTEVKEVQDIPVIFLTASGDEASVVTGLNMGADDYITKPFNPLELVARVKTQLRRYTRSNPSSGCGEEIPQEYDIRGLQISKANHKCFLFEEELSLTPLEFSILWYLCSRQGQVVSSEELFEAAWGEKFMDSNNTVMSHIARLREKMHENSRKPKFIKTVWGVGYTIE